MPVLTIRPFTATDQNAVQQLILAGLAEHWGTLDPAFNHDLHDIVASYTNRGHYFAVAEQNGHIVGTGALLTEGEENGRLVRMSVAKASRRQGIARQLLQHLISIARQRGYPTLFVETNDDWHEALNFYQKSGFVVSNHRDEEIHMKMELGNNISQ